MKSLLVTGGTGFIGSHTCLVLLEKGYNIYVIDSLANSSSLAIDNILKIYNLSCNKFSNKINFIQGDLRNKDIIDETFQRAQNSHEPIEGVIHFAGLKSVEESTKKPILYWQVNVLGTMNLLEVMQKYHCRTIVFSSSATIYGTSSKSPLVETSSIKPINPYGTTKYANELILNDVFNGDLNNWKIAILRYFNPIGSHHSGMLGEAPNGIPNNIFPYICQLSQGKLKQLQIFGKDWPTKDGTGVRDYIHVMDLAEGHLAALECLFSEESQLLTVNLGTGKGTSVLELVETFEKVNKCRLKYVFTDRRAGDSAIVFANIDKAKSRLNWKPKRNLKDMCKDGWLWQKLNPNGYQ